MKTFLIIILIAMVIWFISPKLPEPPAFSEVAQGISDFLSSEYSEGQVEQHISKLNIYRNKNGVGSLKLSPELTNLAQKRVKEIKGDFSHDNCPPGCAEIIAALGGYEPLEAWKQSPIHNSIMLDPTYTITGFAVKNGFAVELFQ